MLDEEKKINILELAGSLSYAGTERVMLTFAKYLNRDFFNVFVTSYGCGGLREEHLKRMKIDYLIANYSIDAIIDFVKKNKINILHFHRCGKYIAYEFEIMRKVKEFDDKIVIIETNVFGKFDRLSDKYIDCHLNISKIMLNERYARAVGRFDFQKVKVVYNPVDYKHFENFAVNVNDIKKYKHNLGINENDFVIGKLGRPHIAKWGDLVLEMMPYLVKFVPNIKFIIRSAPNSRIKKVKRSKYNNYFIFLENTSDDMKIALFYSAIDIYVHASKIGESFGMTLAEAGIFKKPVVVNSTPTRDNTQIELIDHMKSGIIANHPQTFARAIAYLYKNPEKRREMGGAGYVKVLKEYNPEKITIQLEKVFIEKLVEKGYPVNQSIIDFYNGIEYEPSELEILAYKEEYQRKLKQEFSSLSFRENLINLFNKPGKFYYKVRDFLEHRLNI